MLTVRGDRWKFNCSMLHLFGNNERKLSLIPLLLVLSRCAVISAASYPAQRNNNNNNNPNNNNMRGIYRPPLKASSVNGGGNLLVLDKLARPIPILPGLLDETLLLRGSFSFDAKTVKFDKLKVLGNVYARRINGRLLRDSYLVRSSISSSNKRRSQQDYEEPNQKPSDQESSLEELRLQILKWLERASEIDR